MSVAHQFPARTQPDGRVYRRGRDHDGRLADGWTDNPAHSHGDYFLPGAPAPLPATAPNAAPAVSVPPDTVNDAQNAAQADSTTTSEETPMTALTDDFDIAPRETEYEGFPLPPETPRPESKFNGWGWYKLPDPDTGLPSAFPRATTVAKALADLEGLAKWGRRETVARILELTAMAPDTRLSPRFETTADSALKALHDAMASDKATAPDAVLDMIDNLMGGAAARELGECVHAWLEALDMGIVLLRDVPDIVRPHVDAYRRVIAHRGLVPVPEFVERTCLNRQCNMLPDDDGEPTRPGESVAGKIDRIYRIVTTGELVLGDVKTSKDLQYSWLEFGVQVGGVYGWAEWVLSLDGTKWEPMPELRDDIAILMHVPSNAPAQAAAITINKWWGGAALLASVENRMRRKEAKVEVPKHAIPVPSEAAIRYATARNELSAIESLDQGQAVYESFEDVWDDALDEHATRVAALLDQ